jgi:hypothetical protein
VKPLFDHSGADGGILREQIGDGGFEGVELAGLGTRDRGLVRSLEIFLDGAPAHAQIAFDLADRPAFRVIELVQGLDLLVAQHWGSSSLFQARAADKPEGCCSQDSSEAGGLRSGRCTTKTCAEAKLLFARSWAAGPNSQTPATDDFRSSRLRKNGCEVIPGPFHRVLLT